MPTTVRAAGVGSSSLVSKIGGTLSTTVAALADIQSVKSLPVIDKLWSLILLYHRPISTGLSNPEADQWRRKEVLLRLLIQVSSDTGHKVADTGAWAQCISYFTDSFQHSAVRVTTIGSEITIALSLFWSDEGR